MKFTVAFLVFFMESFLGFAQQQVTVSYKLEYLTSIKSFDPDSNNVYKWLTYIPATEYELAIYGQRASFRNNCSCLLMNNHHNRFPGDTIIAYTDLMLGYNFIPVPPITEKILMLKDAANKLSWSFSRDMDTICGFPCRMAITIVENEYVYAWYAFDLPPNFGPMGYTGLPGTILSLEFTSTQTRYHAQNVSDVSRPIFIPETAHIDPEEYSSIMKEKRSYRGGLLGRKIDPYEMPRIFTASGNVIR